ncbi:resolvase-like protein [Kribbella orskensis]|uniref:Resolvase-like protein n=1 Tax=Kribbella orskensis TaxID=2512216 RepID=A0ABY2B6T2_9ACTN|nr:resolvase-like protein [Kribbella sp. VKM Ac-2500]TCO09560.1 resolvase-like protein [Kribbella orskensis]
MGRIDFGDLQSERRYSGQRAYNASKLANVMFTYEQARRLEGTGVTATVLHPGVVRTSFAAEDPSPLYRVLMPLARLFMKTPEQGAATSVYLASSLEVEGVTGRYFANRKPRQSSKASYDEPAAARLWQVSLISSASAAPVHIRRRLRTDEARRTCRQLRHRSGPAAIGPALAGVGRAAEDAWSLPIPGGLEPYPAPNTPSVTSASTTLKSEAGYPYAVECDRDSDRLCPLLHRRTGPDRATRHLARARRSGYRIYLDKGLTGTNRRRPGLDQSLAAVRAGDTLVVPKLDRLARSVPDARDIGDTPRSVGSGCRWAGSSTTRLTRWARCSSTSWPPSPSSRSTCCGCGPGKGCRCAGEGQAPR